MYMTIFDVVPALQVLMIMGQLLSKVPGPVIWLVIEDPSAVTKHDNTVRVVQVRGGVQCS